MAIIQYEESLQSREIVKNMFDRYIFIQDRFSKVTCILKEYNIYIYLSTYSNTGKLRYNIDIM